MSGQTLFRFPTFLLLFFLCCCFLLDCLLTGIFLCSIVMKVIILLQHINFQVHYHNDQLDAILSQMPRQQAVTKGDNICTLPYGVKSIATFVYNELAPLI